MAELAAKARELLLNSRLPGILELSRTFAHVDPVKEPIPVVPAVHFTCGGIVTDLAGRNVCSSTGRVIDLTGSPHYQAFMRDPGTLISAAARGARRPLSR